MAQGAVFPAIAFTRSEVFERAFHMVDIRVEMDFALRMEQLQL